MIQHSAPFFVGLLAVLAAGCNQQDGTLGQTTPTLPVGMNGSWTGVLDDFTLVQVDMLEQPGPIQTGSGFPEPGYVVTGSGFLTSGGCTQSVTVSGKGDGRDYVVQFLGSGVNPYVIELYGVFEEPSAETSLNDRFLGGYFMTFGDPSEACISGGSGLFELGRTAIDGVEGTFTGSWTGADSLSFRTSQTNALVYGAARWSEYTCARDAFFYGTRSGDQVVGTLVPLFSSLTSYDVVFDWDSDARTIDGSFTVTGIVEGSTCTVGDTGSFSVGSISNAEAGPSGSAVSVTVLELDDEGGEPDVVLQYEARGD